MEKKLLLIFFALNSISVIYGVTVNTDDDETYEFDGLFSKILDVYKNSRRVEEYSAFHQLKLGGIDNILKFKPVGNLLQNSSKCLDDILYIFNNTGSPWAMKMIDSYGKPESGILKGNLRWIGDYNECVGIRVSNPNSTTVGNFRGKYCSLTWPLKSLNLSLPYTFVSGVCIPDSCSAEELQQVALQILRMTGAAPVLSDSNSTLNSNVLKCKPTERHLGTGAIAVIVLLSVFLMLTTLGSSITVAKYFKRRMQESTNLSHAGDMLVNNQIKGDTNSTLDKQVDETLQHDAETVAVRVSVLENLKMFLQCFCVFTNGAKLLNTASSEGELLCIHGIRFLSMSWVIIGHVYSVGTSEMKNMLDMASLIDDFPFQAVFQAFYSVDSFFVLSGFLLMFLSMKEFTKTKGKISWPHFYIHRYLRLTPIYMIVIGFYSTVFLYLGSGPYWPDGDYDESCSKIWWKNLLYINNFDTESGQCMAYSWYLANDMQFFIISPLFLITLWRWPKIGYSLLALFLLTSFLCNFFITYHFDLSNGYITYLNEGIRDWDTINSKFLLYYDKLYVKPYARIGPYLVGMLTGFIFFKRQSSNAPKHNTVFLIVGWIVASSVTLATVYGLYHTHPGLIARSVYNGLSHICYGAGLSWVIYVCLIGQGGIVNSLLSFKLFIPLSRLTYSAYLVHPLVVGTYLLSLKSSLEFSQPSMVVLFLGLMLLAYSVALPVALIFESPIVALEKLIRKKFTTGQKTKAVN